MIKIETCVDYGYKLGNTILKGSLMNCKHQEAVIHFPGPSNALNMSVMRLDIWLPVMLDPNRGK